jgi:DNA invertase Pin-like site-specific DNA recombinase
MPTPLRCAIYARVSSDERLAQDFNSLDAQREACQAYVRSQAELGWRLLKDRYEDGGYSGGTLERPALQRLLDDVRQRRLDVIVLYKIDRLTRSLTDFARLAELLDAHGVSFVSVTQQFNTTTSMGRLMLNVLLSFAQFEREITGERIRDKIAASKRKGLWMGGVVPLGYRADGRTLVIDPAEAATVRTIFAEYLAAGTVTALATRTKALGLRTRPQSGDPAPAAGRWLTRGHLYRILQNPIYRGQIRHRDAVYPGQHAAIIDADTWEKVQAQLAANLQGHRHRVSVREPSLLAGLLVMADGTRLVPSHATKGIRRYRYYIHESLVVAKVPRPDQGGMRLPAPALERAVQAAIRSVLAAPSALLPVLDGGLSATDKARVLASAPARAAALAECAVGDWIRQLREWLVRVELHPGSLHLIWKAEGLRAWLGLPPGGEPGAAPRSIVPVTLVERGHQVRFVIERPEADPANTPDAVLTRLVARGWAWRQRIEAGAVDSLQAIATGENLTASYVGRVLRLAYLAPDILEAIVAGRAPPSLTAQRLLYLDDLPLDWVGQRARLGFPPG